jgi:colicin import membrane protein
VDAADRLEFAPPPQPGLARGLGIAILAHLLLLAALTWGVKWKRDAQDAAAEAELWAAVPEQAAPVPPEVVKAPPAPPPPPIVCEQPKPEPKPREADIAAEREQQRKRQEAERREAEEDRREREAKKREQEQKAREKAAEERKREEAQARQEQARKAAAEQQRKQRLAQLQAMAGGPVTGSAASAGAGLSKSYAVRLASLFKRNMRFPGGVDSISGNPQAEVRVRVGPGGTILNVRVTKPSGNPAWDAAVVRAIESTERIPPDENGKYATDFPLDWGPKD